MRRPAFVFGQGLVPQSSGLGLVHLRPFRTWCSFSRAFIRSRGGEVPVKGLNVIPESLGGVAVLSGTGTLPKETEWDCSKPSVGLGGVTLVLVDGFLDLSLLLFLESAPRTSGPYDLAIIWAVNLMLVTLDGSFVKLELLRMPEHYATLVVYLASFHKYPEPFLCLIGMSQMDLLYFIRTADPTKVRIGERKRDEDEPKLLETTVGHVDPLLPVAPDRSFGELEASVDKLFDEGGSGEQADQGDSASGGHGVGVQPVNVIAEVVVEDVVPAELQRKKKRKTKVVDAGEPSHPAKKLRGDYGVSGEPTVGGKSQSAVQRLLVGAVQHAKVRGGVMPTFSFVSSSVFTTPKCKGGDHAEFLAGANLRTLEAPQRFVILSDSSDHSGANIAEAEVDYIVRTSVPIMTSGCIGLAKWGLLVSAHDEYFRKRGCIGVPWMA
nr:hypothetical protein [Tanacetum cinerariifolium]